MIMAVAGASVPKISVNCGASYGAGTYGMNGRAFDPRFMFSWPRSQVGVMGAEQAADVLSSVKIRQLEREGRTPTPEAIAAIRAPGSAGYRRASRACPATSALWGLGRAACRERV